MNNTITYTELWSDNDYSISAWGYIKVSGNKFKVNQWFDVGKYEFDVSKMPKEGYVTDDGETLVYNGNEFICVKRYTW